MRMKKSRISISAEFFPPKTEEGARQILRAANAMKGFPFDFVSITYGAGGSSRERTLEYGKLLREIFNFDVMPHLTCVGHSQDDLRAILRGFRESGFSKVMALRGDPPRGDADFAPHPDGFGHASDLVGLIRREFPEIIPACAGYPEKHPEAASLEDDIKNLKLKTDIGAEMILTQLFFDNSMFFSFVEKCRAAGIDKPIHAGIMPALSLKQARTFCAMCGSSIPPELERSLEAAGSEEAERAAGLEWAKRQITELIERGAEGIHFYILNRPKSAIALISHLEESL